MQYKPPRLAVAGLFLSSLILPALAQAQQAFTVPRSNRVIFGELTIPNEPDSRNPEKKMEPTKVRFVVRDGNWVTVEDRKAKYFFGFNGVINDQTGNPNFVAYELIRNNLEDTSVVELDQAPRNANLEAAMAARDIRIGRSVNYSSARNIRLRVTGTGEWAFATPYISDPSQYSFEDLDQDFGVSINGGCCITCMSRTVCATSVSTSCGDCGGGGGGGLSN